MPWYDYVTNNDNNDNRSNSHSSYKQTTGEMFCNTSALIFNSQVLQVMILCHQLRKMKIKGITSSRASPPYCADVIRTWNVLWEGLGLELPNAKVCERKNRNQSAMTKDTIDEWINLFLPLQKHV